MRRRGRLSPEQLPLGDDVDIDVDTTLTVGELNHAIATSVVDAFPRPVWVRGEIQQLKRYPNGHAYFELVEKHDVLGGVRAAVSVALFRDARVAVNRSLRDTPGVKITDGVEVRICGRVDYYPKTGRLQLKMTAIDPVFTVGKLAADRERLLRVLAEEGILRANAEIDVPLVPLRVGLVTSGGSAAYRDFVHQLEASGHAFEVAHVDVRVQGAAASRRVAYALRQLAGMALDVVVIVRGGGARSDLAAFDAEIVARAIAGMPTPVFTGIGHEVDRTVSDEVAHTCCKTPTAAAALLVEHVDDFDARLAWVGHRVSARAQRACGVARRQLDDLARRARRGVPLVLARERQAIAGHRRSITAAGHRGTRRALQRVDAAQDRLRALDPRRVLERGYTITRGPDGAVVRSASAVGVGDALVTETADGAVHSRVEETELRTTPPRGDGGSAERSRPGVEDG